MEKAQVVSFADADIVRKIKSKTEKALVGSIWEWEHIRGGKVIDAWEDHNLMTDEGIDYMLDTAFSGATPIASFYIAVFESNHTPATGNTYATPGYTECTAYDETTRPGWSEAGVAAKVITNSASKATFTFNATKTIYGASLVGGGTAATTIGDAAGGGTLVCEAQFTSGPKYVVSSDVLKVTVSMTGSNVA